MDGRGRKELTPSIDAPQNGCYFLCRITFGGIPMEGERKNYWEEKQEEDKNTILQILQELGVARKDISLHEDLCVFPYKNV